MMLPGLVETHEGLAPPLKWAGGKRWLVSRLYALWRVHQDKRLVEPFAGGLAIVLGLRPKRALLNDANEHLIAFTSASRLAWIWVVCQLTSLTIAACSTKIVTALTG